MLVLFILVWQACMNQNNDAICFTGVSNTRTTNIIILNSHLMISNINLFRTTIMLH